MNRRTAPATAGIALAALLAACAGAPEAAPAPSPEPAALDRTEQPEAGPSPSIDLPDVERRTLSNGLPVWIVEQSELPLVTLRLVVDAGSAAESAGQSGLASFTAGMLDEGTSSRDALEIADELDFLGASFGAGAGYDAAFLTLSTLDRHLPAALAVFADVLRNPSFPEAEMERERGQRLAGLLQARDNPSSVASDEFALRIYGPDHPYGRDIGGTHATLGSFSADDLRRFHSAFYRPNNAHLIVVGAVDADRVTTLLEQALGGWEPADVPEIRYPPAPAPQQATRVYLIDKPGAAQSQIRIGHVGVARDAPDYFPLLVMNTVLGGQFSSRINLNLREDKGYTYGARSSFSMRRQPGPFLASAGVQTPSTKASVVEFMKELEEVRADRPVTPEELAFAKARLVREEPLELETNWQIAGRLEDVILYGLPEDYFDHFTERVEAVTLDEVNRAAREYVHPDRLAIVVVGDREVIEAGLRELPYPVEVVELAPVEAGGAE